MKKRFVFTLGKNVFTKGHRFDCAQIKVQLAVEAESKEEAIKLLREGEGQLVGYELGEDKHVAHAPCDEQACVAVEEVA